MAIVWYVNLSLLELKLGILFNDFNAEVTGKPRPLTDSDSFCSTCNNSQ